MGALPVELHPVEGARPLTWISHFCERPGLAPGRTLRQSPEGFNSIGDRARDSTHIRHMRWWLQYRAERNEPWLRAQERRQRIQESSAAVSVARR